MSDQQTRGALIQHWTASDAGDFATERNIYHEDALLGGGDLSIYRICPKS